MPILLTTPYTAPGAHGEADEVYAMVMMSGFNVKPAASITILTLEYGNVVDGKWVSSSRVEPKRIVLRDTPEEQGMAVDPETNQQVVTVVRPAVTDFTDLRDALPEPSTKAAGLDYYDALSGDLYTWLIAQGYYTGSIV